MTASIHGHLSNSDVADGKWHHYAVSIAKINTNMRVRLYRDSVKISDQLNSNVIGNIEGITGGLNATIGALVSTPNVLWNLVYW